jgi:hypothetical protein
MCAKQYMLDCPTVRLYIKNKREIIEAIVRERSKNVYRSVIQISTATR